MSSGSSSNSCWGTACADSSSAALGNAEADLERLVDAVEGTVLGMGAAPPLLSLPDEVYVTFKEGVGMVLSESLDLALGFARGLAEVSALGFALALDCPNRC